MRPVKISYTAAAAGTSNAAVVDHYQCPINIGFVLTLTGTITASVQHTYDDVLDSTVTPAWFDHATVKAVTSTTEGTYTSPIRFIRINKTAGTGSAVLTL